MWRSPNPNPKKKILRIDISNIWIFFQNEWVKMLFRREREGKRGDGGREKKKKRHVLWDNDLFCFFFFI